MSLIETAFPVETLNPIAMAKAIEWYTKVAANRPCHPLLEDLLKGMAGLVAQVHESAASGRGQAAGPHAIEVRQLALFVMESQEKYGEKPAAGQPNCARTMRDEVLAEHGSTRNTIRR